MSSDTALTCTGCGAPLHATAQFCSVCGSDVARPAGAHAPTSRAAQLSVILGLLGVTIVPFVCSPAAIVYALRARRETASDPNLAGSTAALVGLALGITGVCVFGLIGLLAVVEVFVR